MNVRAGIRKEDDLYYEGPFWIIGESIKDIYKGNFSLVGLAVEVDYKGDYLDSRLKKKGATAHSKLWATNEYKEWNTQFEYDYFPRGRVRICEGEVYLHINSKMNTPRIINAVIQEYNLHKFGNAINIEEDDLLQGSHYGYKLR